MEKVECRHIAEDNWIKFILKRTDEGYYSPLTRYRCSKCGEEFISDGIWWVIPGNISKVIFEPIPMANEIVINLGFAKIKIKRK